MNTGPCGYPPGSKWRPKFRPVSESRFGPFPLREVITFPNGRRRFRPRFRRNRPIWGAALRHGGFPAIACAFAGALLFLWFLIAIVAPFFDGQVAAALGR
ncbi:MAG TPA: hypothetical protein VHX37_13390 [Acidobacteriaceae bacterium]|jgi:hypothetical protein|nr:hypothetical protein [Acidobacteriaceae bacterium]